MPVELRVETEGKTEIEARGRGGYRLTIRGGYLWPPAHIAIDPDNWVLKNNPDLQVQDRRPAWPATGRGGRHHRRAGGVPESPRPLTPNSSLASYRIGEVLFNQRNYQAAANAYSDALRGDDEPKWTEVWSHIALGKIFDVTGQRDRAVNEYRQAVQTNDNTQGAVNEARKYLEEPDKRPDTE